MFRSLLELHSEDRITFDRKIAGLEPPLAERVQRLRELHDSDTSRLERHARTLLGTDAVPDRLGAFTLLRELGRGGMGVVAEAQREAEGFTQRAAIKWIPAWQVDTARRQRFLFERDVVARLRHPHIAQLVDGGEGENGELWYAMELVEGQDLLQHARQRMLDLRGRVRLLLDLCEAVAYAHRNLILHRDIKPSNVLVDREGQLKLIDFGIAKGLDETSEGLTQDASPMTPRYAAPEQLRGERPTTASDVWQVAAVAFELLSGRPARKNGKLRRASQAALEEGDDTPAWGLDARGLFRALRGDLDAILQKGLRDAPEERYSNIEELAADLRAWLRGQPVAVRRNERWYALGRYVAIHRWSVAFGALALTSLIVGLTVAASESRRAAVEARAAEDTNTLMLRAFLGGSGRIASTLTLRTYFDYVTELVVQDATLSPKRRYQLLLQILDSTQEVGISETVEQSSRVLIEQAREIFGNDSLEAAFAMDRWAYLALRQRGATAAEEADASLTESNRIYHALGLNAGPRYLSHLRARAHLANVVEDLNSLIGISQEMVHVASTSEGTPIVDKLGLQSLLASAYFRAQRYAEADQTMRDTLDEYAEALSTDTTLTDGYLFNRARACEYRAFHDASDAAQFCSSLIDEFEQSNSMNSEMGIWAMRGLAEAHSRLGNHHEALKVLRSAGAIADELYGDSVLPALYARILRSQGRETYTLGLYKESAEIRQRLLSWSDQRRAKDSEDGLEMRIELMESLLAAGETEASASLLDTTLNLSSLSAAYLERWQRLSEQLAQKHSGGSG